MISVIIPTYNRPNLLEQSINSILQQTYKNFELIIVDGSDNIDSKTRVESLKDDRTKYVKIDNISAAHSRNCGIEVARGEFVAFNDDDDIWLPDKLEKQLGRIQSIDDPKVIYTSFEKQGRSYKRVTPAKTVQKTSGYIFDEILFRNFVGLQTMMLPRSICGDKPFDENLKCLEDWEWTMRLGKQYPFDLIRETLVVARDTPSSVNKSEYATKASAYAYIYKKHISEINKYPRIKAKHLLSIGNNLCLSGNISEGKKYLFQSLKIYPPNILALLSFLTSLAGAKTYKQLFKFYESTTKKQP